MAAWFVKWTRTTAEQETVHMAKFEEGLGRVMFVTGALEHERPFVAPLYKFMISHPRHMCRSSSGSWRGRLNRGDTTLAQCGLSQRHPLHVWTRRLRQRERGSEAGFPQCDKTVRWTCGRHGGSVWS